MKRLNKLYEANAVLIQAQRTVSNLNLSRADSKTLDGNIRRLNEIFRDLQFAIVQKIAKAEARGDS